MRPWIRPAAPAIALAVLLLLPAAVAADCMEPPPLEQAVAEGQSVFVGTVVGLENEARWATVRVEDVWRGPDLPAVVGVRGGEEPGTFTSLDRTYRQGATYLFVVMVEQGAAAPRLVDNSCTPTSEWREELAALRPGTARPPVPSTGETAGPGTGGVVAGGGLGDSTILVVSALLVLAGCVAVFGGAVLIRRRR
jgi:hypothetical protein